jgi:hypothetical protein
MMRGMYLFCFVGIHHITLNNGRHSWCCHLAVWTCLLCLCRFDCISLLHRVHDKVIH